MAVVQSRHLHNAVIFQRQHTPQDSEYDVVFSENSPALNGNLIWAEDRGRKANLAVMRAYPGRSYWLLDTNATATALTKIHPKSP